jgi:ParB family chromosome partitioning protein
MMKTAAGMMKLYKMIIEENLSVRAAEAIAKGQSTKKSKHTSRKSLVTNPQIRSVENELITVLGTKVRLHYSKKGGRIEIQFFSDDDLDRVLDLLRSIE